MPALHRIPFRPAENLMLLREQMGIQLGVVVSAGFAGCKRGSRLAISVIEMNNEVFGSFSWKWIHR